MMHIYQGLGAEAARAPQTLPMTKRNLAWWDVAFGAAGVLLTAVSVSTLRRRCRGKTPILGAIGLGIGARWAIIGLVSAFGLATGAGLDDWTDENALGASRGRSRRAAQRPRRRGKRHRRDEARHGRRHRRRRDAGAAASAGMPSLLCPPGMTRGPDGVTCLPFGQMFTSPPTTVTAVSTPAPAPAPVPPTPWYCPAGTVVSADGSQCVPIDYVPIPGRYTSGAGARFGSRLVTPGGTYSTVGL